jgi:putative ABC transport system permease protein
MQAAEYHSGRRWLADLMQDLRIGARAISRRPGTAVVPILSSALGISACSLIVAVANMALFRPLPVANGAGLMSISAQNLKTGEIGSAISYPDYRELSAARSLEKMAAYFPMMPAAISANGTEPRRYWGTIATANYFDAVKPGFSLGRGFEPSRDDRPGSPPVIVLSHHLWFSRFGGDPGAIGRAIIVNGRNTTVVGIARPGFWGTDVAMVSDFWLPMSMRDAVVSMLPANQLDVFADRNANWLFGVGRLARGVTREHADAEVKVIARRLAAGYPATNQNRSFYVERAGQLAPAVRRAMLVFFILLLSVCGLVLLTACANTANLLLARATARNKEMATRRAVGADAGRLVRQLLTESILLALLGGALGYLIANLGAHCFGRLRLPMALPVDLSVRLDIRVLAFCTGLSFLTGVVFGLAPALHAVRQNLISGLKNEPVRLGRSRWVNVVNLLMIGQVAICMVLLICSGLFLRTLNSARTAETGMAYRNVVLIGFDPFLQGAPGRNSDRLDEILRRVRAVPGVDAAALTTTVPLSLAGVSGSVTADDNPDHKDRSLEADIYRTSAGFFETLGIRLISGEDFRAGDERQVAILNRAAADRLFHGRNPLDRSVRIDDGSMLRVIGIVATTKSRMIVETARPCIYRPINSAGGANSLTGLTLLARVQGSPGNYAPQVTAAMREVDRGLPVFDVRTMEQHMDDALLLQRAGAFLFGIAGCIGVILAAAGLYGLISFSVTLQTKEMGIRMALGARRSQILSSVLFRGLRLTAAGSALGLVLAVILGKGIASLLYGVTPLDRFTFASVTVFLLVTALAACLVPALRAANVPPVSSIRME